MSTAAATNPDTDETRQFAPPTPMPDFLSPVFVKELRQGLRARRFVMPFVFAQVMAIVAVGTELGIASAGPDAGSGNFTGFLGGVLYLVLWIVIGLVMPLTNIGALRPELAGGRNVELLLMSNLNRWQIVRGKWLVGFSLSFLMLISLIPYLLTRYFSGGVDLVGNLLQVFLVFLLNGVLTALAIGASGFGNLIGRILILGIGLLSFMGTGSATGWSAFDNLKSGSSSVWAVTIFVLVGLLVSALYVVFGLQLGRSRLRLFENPIDPPPSGLVIALMIFTPIVVGISTVATGGHGGWVAVAGLLILTLMIDRGPGKDTAISYAQP